MLNDPTELSLPHSILTSMCTPSPLHTAPSAPPPLGGRRTRHKLTVHARVYKRSGTDKCPVCSQKETVKHAMVECPMFKAAAAVIQHYYG